MFISRRLLNYSPLIGTGAFNSFLFHFFAAPQVDLREGEEFRRFVRFFWCCWLVVHCTWLQQPVHPSRTHLGDVQHFMGWKQPVGSVHCPARSALRFAAFCGNISVDAQTLGWALLVGLM